MASLPPLLPTPPASIRLRDTDAVESRSPKQHRDLEPETSGSGRREPNSPPSSRHRAGKSPPPPSKVLRLSRSPLPSRVRRRSRSRSPSRVRSRSRSPPPSRVRRRSRSPSPSRVRRRSRSPSPSRVRRRSRCPSPSRVRRRSRSPSPSKVRRRSRSPPPSKVRRRSRLPPPSKVRCRSRSPSKVWHRSRSPSKVRRRSRSPPYVSVTQRLAKPQRTKRLSEAAVEGDRARSSSLDESSVENQPSHSHSNCKVPSRNSCRKKMKRPIWAEAKKEFREMKRDKLLENIKKLQACVWLLEKDGADMAEIMEFRSLLESTKKEYVELEAQLANEGSRGPLQVLKRDRLEKTHVERDGQNMDSGKVEVSDEVSERNELAEEVNRLKSELETVRGDRDYQLAQAQSLMADVAKQKEVARRYGVELEDAMRRVAALEEGCLLRRETIKELQIQLASADD